MHFILFKIIPHFHKQKTNLKKILKFIYLVCERYYKKRRKPPNNLNSFPFSWKKRQLFSPENKAIKGSSKNSKVNPFESFIMRMWGLEKYIHKNPRKFIQYVRLLKPSQGKKDIMLTNSTFCS